METPALSKSGLAGLLLLVTIGLASLVISLTRNSSNQIFITGNNVQTSTFAVSVYDNTGQFLFSASPLNDFYYTINGKDHFEDKITRSDNGNWFQNLWIATKSLVLNKRELVWNTVGNSSVGKIAANYLVSQVSRGVELQRQIIPSSQFNYLGQAIKFCPDCLVVDDKNRIYFNADTLKQFDIDTAARLHLTPVVVGENQFLPPDVTFIRIIDGENNLKLEIPLNGTQVYLDYRWRLLEFKAKLNQNQNLVEQEIYLNE